MSVEIPEFIKKQFFEFRKIYRNWFKELSDSFVENKKPIIKYYKEHMNDEHELILKTFFNNIDPYLNYICDIDYTFFDNCNSFYTDIDYHLLINSEVGKSENFRKSQMAYLTKLSYMSIMLFDFTDKENNEDVKNKMEKYSPLLIKLLSNIQSLDGTNMDNLMQNFENTFSSGNFEEMEKNFMSGNPILCDLAEEISKEVKIPDNFKNLKNPQDIFKIMFDKEGKQFMEDMVKTVGSKIQNKIQTGKINEKDLIQQAQQMMSSVFKDSPLFGATSQNPTSSNDETNTQDEKIKKEELRKKLRENIKKRKH
jgi:hypothetical protein